MCRNAREGEDVFISEDGENDVVYVDEEVRELCTIENYTWAV